MKNRRFAIFFLLAVFSIFGAVRTERPAQAQPNVIEGCVPLDLVLIIDQSDSMRTTDPTNQRLVAAKEALQRLYLNTGLNCPQTVGRVAAVEFGSTVQRIFDWQEVSVPSVTDKRWERELSGLQSRFVSRELGQTNFSGAFREAAELFKQLPDDDAQRAVILITDGLPCMGDRTGSVRQCQSPAYVEHYFSGSSLNAPDEWINDPERNGLVSGGLINQINRDFPNRIYKMSVLYFDAPNAPAGQARRFADESWRSLTSARGGKYIDPTKLNTREAIVQELSDIMNDLLNVKAQRVACDVPVYIEPYTNATSLFTTIGPRDFLNMRILGPNGIVIQENNIQPAAFAANIDRQLLDSVLRYIIRNPTPGEWRVQGTTDEKCQRIQITYEGVSARASLLPETPKNGRVLVNVISPYSTPSEDGYIEIALRDSFGNLFQEIEGHPLEVIGRVIAAPSLEAKTKLDALPPIRFSQVRSGVWRSDKLPAPERVPDNGQRYQLLIEGRVKSVKPGGEFIPVFKLETSYGTLPPAAINLVPVEPRDGAELALNRVEGNQSIVLPFSVSARVVQAEGNVPQPANLVFAVRGDAESSVYATLLRGARTVERIALKPSSGDPTLLVGTFRTNVSPAERTENDVEGSYTVRFEVDPRVVSEGRYNTDTYVFEQTSPAPVTIKRLELFGLEIRPISQPRPKFLINRFEGGKSLYNALEVEAQILDVFNNRPAVTSEAFARTENLVYVTLFAPDNSALVRLPLQYRASTNTFVGTLFNTPETQFDTTGIHSLRFSLENAVREGAPYQIIKAESEPQFFERVLRTGVVAQITRPRDQAELDLNRLDGKTQVPIPFAVTVRFTDAVRNTPLNPRTAMLSAEASALQALRLEVRDANDALFKSVPLSEGQLNEVTGEVALTVPFEKQDFSRLRTVKFALAVDASKLGDRANPELLFELIQEQLRPVAIQTAVINGASLQLVQLGTDNAPSAAQPSRMPLYDDFWSAFNAQPKPAKVAFLILDQDDQALSLEQLGILESDPNLVSERLAKLIKARVRPPAAEEPVDLTAFRVEQRIDLPLVFVTEINGAFNEEGDYVLDYRMDGGQLPRTIRPIQGEDGGTATLQRFIENAFLNPETWSGLRTALIVLAALFVGNLVRVNVPIPLLAGHRLSGVLNIEIDKSRHTVRLGRWHLWRNITRRSMRVSDPSISRLHVKVTSRGESGKYTVRFKLEFKDKNKPPQGLAAYQDWTPVEVTRSNTSSKPVTKSGGRIKLYFS